MATMPWRSADESPRTVVIRASSDSSLDHLIRSSMCPSRHGPDFGTMPDGSPAPPLKDRKLPFEDEARLAALAYRYLNSAEQSPIWDRSPFWVAPDCRIAPGPVLTDLMGFAQHLVIGRRALSCLGLEEASGPDAVAARQELDRLKEDLIDQVVEAYRYLQSLQQMGAVLDRYSSRSVDLPDAQMIQSGVVDVYDLKGYRQHLDLAVEAIKSAYDEII